MGILTVLTKKHGVVISLVISFRLLDILFNILVFKKYIYSSPRKSNLNQQFENLGMVTKELSRERESCLPNFTWKLSMVSHCPIFGLFAYSASSVWKSLFSSLHLVNSAWIISPENFAAFPKLSKLCLQCFSWHLCIFIIVRLLDVLLFFLWTTSSLTYHI